MVKILSVALVKSKSMLENRDVQEHNSEQEMEILDQDGPERKLLIGLSISRA